MLRIKQLTFDFRNSGTLSAILGQFRFLQNKPCIFTIVLYLDWSCSDWSTG